MLRAFSYRTALGAAMVAVTGLALSPASATARVFFGVGLGFPLFPPPVYYPPPIYYPPPVYYAPPVQYAPPPVGYSAPPAQYAPSPTGQTCYAGAYTCPMDRPTVAGAACYCVGNGGNRIWGRAN